VFKLQMRRVVGTVINHTVYDGTMHIDGTPDTNVIP
jgi:hypothetical protein